MLFPKFFSTIHGMPGGFGGKSPGRQGEIRRPKQQCEEEFPNCAGIEASAQHRRRAVKDPHLAVVEGEGEHKEPCRRREPVRQVQQKGQPPPGQHPAHRPHAVVEKAHGGPQEHPLGEGQRLRRDVYPHTGQRKSRAKKPPFTGDGSSS